MLIVKLTDTITQRLAALGVEKPSTRLTDELERLLVPKVGRLIDATLTRRLVARAFAATLTTQGVLGDARQRSPKQAANRPLGTDCVACQEPTTTTPL